MEQIICGLIFIVTVAALGYDVYRSFRRNEVVTCYGEHYRFDDDSSEADTPGKRGDGFFASYVGGEDR